MRAVTKFAVVALLVSGGVGACGGEMSQGDVVELGSLDTPLEIDIDRLLVASNALVAQDLPRCTQRIAADVELMRHPGSRNLVVVVSKDGAALCVTPGESLGYLLGEKARTAASRQDVRTPSLNDSTVRDYDPVPIRPCSGANFAGQASPQGDDPVPIKPEDDIAGDDPVPIKPNDASDSPFDDDPVPIKPNDDAGGTDPQGDDPVPIKPSENTPLSTSPKGGSSDTQSPRLIRNPLDPDSFIY